MHSILVRQDLRQPDLLFDDVKGVNITKVSIHVKNAKIKLDNSVLDIKTTLLVQNKCEKSARYIFIDISTRC